jgi:hypothetical protein
MFIIKTHNYYYPTQRAFNSLILLCFRFWSLEIQMLQTVMRKNTRINNVIL